ncbi:unnamed protein product, partial [marine sediment metagenome]
TVVCPICGKNTPLVNNWWLHKKKKIRLNYELIDGNIVYEIIENGDIQEGNIKRYQVSCLYCSSKIEYKHIVEDISKNEREIILAVYLDNRKFELPTKDDRKAIKNANKYLKNNIKELSRFIPIEPIPSDINAARYLKYWYRLYSPRQLVVLTSLCKEIRIIVEQLSKEDRDYASAIGTYLSMILTKHVNYNSRCTVWHNGIKAIG